MFCQAERHFYVKAKAAFIKLEKDEPFQSGWAGTAQHGWPAQPSAFGPTVHLQCAHRQRTANTTMRPILTIMTACSATKNNE